MWFSKSLGDGMFASEPLADLKEQCSSIYAKAGAPAEMAVFVRHESEGRLHCEVKVYFSPASAGMARAVGAVPCARPLTRGLSLLVGSEDCWPVLFPEHGR